MTSATQGDRDSNENPARCAPGGVRLEEVGEPASFHVIIVLCDFDKESVGADELDAAAQEISRLRAVPARISRYHDSRQSLLVLRSQFALAFADRLLEEDHLRWIRRHWSSGAPTRFGYEFDVPVQPPPTQRPGRSGRR